MDFAVMADRALAIRRLFEDYERRTYGRPWSLEELTLGLVGDVGDLVKLIQAAEGVREVEEVQTKLEHELADVLWSIIVIADRSEVNLEASFVRTMDELEEFLSDSVQPRPAQ
jgi:NTP pyrophosphatase (non-canonical NTP hydrolase)